MYFVPNTNIMFVMQRILHFFAWLIKTLIKLLNEFLMIFMCVRLFTTSARQRRKKEDSKKKKKMKRGIYFVSLFSLFFSLQNEIWISKIFNFMINSSICCIFNLMCTLKSHIMRCAMGKKSFCFFRLFVILVMCSENSFLRSFYTLLLCQMQI